MTPDGTGEVKIGGNVQMTGGGTITADSGDLTLAATTGSKVGGRGNTVVGNAPYVLTLKMSGNQTLSDAAYYTPNNLYRVDNVYKSTANSANDLYNTAGNTTQNSGSYWRPSLTGVYHLKLEAHIDGSTHYGNTTEALIRAFARINGAITLAYTSVPSTYAWYRSGYTALTFEANATVIIPTITSQNYYFQV